MRLSRVHRILNCKQCDWLKKHIDFNTDKRKNAANKFEKIIFKLMINSVFGKTMINSVFGKTMENLRKRICAELSNNAIDCPMCEQTKFCFTENI